MHQSSSIYTWGVNQTMSMHTIRNQIRASEEKYLSIFRNDAEYKGLQTEQAHGKGELVNPS